MFDSNSNLSSRGRVIHDADGDYLIERRPEGFAVIHVGETDDTLVAVRRTLALAKLAMAAAKATPADFDHSQTTWI